MEIIFILLPASLILAAIALVGFLWSARAGQFEDLDTPARRLLLDEDQQRETGRTNPPSP
jgi:cbb3-type cytochrome oxidase maturation protein